MPITNAPPWIQTITGRRSESAEGVQTLSVRQSCDWRSVGTPIRPRTIRICGTNWGAAEPKSVAARTPDHGSGGSGARNARSCTGGRA